MQNTKHTQQPTDDSPAHFLAQVLGAVRSWGCAPSSALFTHARANLSTGSQVVPGFDQMYFDIDEAQRLRSCRLQAL